MTILNAWQWLEVTAERPPHEPPAAKAYTAAGLPWFSYYDADAKALEGSGILAMLKSIAGMRAKRELAPETADLTGIQPTEVHRLGSAERVGIGRGTCEQPLTPIEPLCA